MHFIVTFGSDIVGKHGEPYFGEIFNVACALELYPRLLTRVYGRPYPNTCHAPFRGQHVIFADSYLERYIKQFDDGYCHIRVGDLPTHYTIWDYILTQPVEYRYNAADINELKEASRLSREQYENYLFLMKEHQFLQRYINGQNS